jgi:MFS family permease
VSRLFPLLVGVFVLETSFFAAVAPLLPEYSHEHDLSKTAAGILLGAYPAGTLVASIPCGWLNVRWGMKQTLLASLGLFAAASVAFALADSIVLLDATRFLQGVAGAGLWTAGMAWLVAASPPERLGEVLGLALGAGIFGVLLGPGLGGIATAIGPELVFSTTGLVAAGLAVSVLGLAGPGSKAELTIRELPAAIRRPAVLAGFWFFTLPAIFAGVIEVLEPLRLAALGASGPLIGVVFVIAAATEALFSPAAGRLSDRRGRLAPVRIGLAGAVVIAIVLPIPATPVLVGVCIALAFAALGMCWAPSLAMISDGCAAANLPFAIALSISNVGWAAGHMLGSTAGASLAAQFSDALPYALLASLGLATLTATLLRRQPAYRVVASTATAESGSTRAEDER